MRAIRRVGADAQAFNSDLFQRLQDPILKISLGIRIAVFLGIALLMVVKPELWESVGIVGASVVLGLLSSLFAWRGSGGLSAAAPRPQELSSEPANHEPPPERARTIGARADEDLKLRDVRCGYLFGVLEANAPTTRLRLRPGWTRNTRCNPPDHARGWVYMGNANAGWPTLS